MILKLIQPNFIFQKLYPNSLWRVKTSEKKVFLTFDDGPTPHITPWILDILKTYHAKATFFCIGKNVAKHPAIYQTVIEAKQTVGNHSYSHLKGWDVENKNYYNDVAQAAQLIDSKLFRPPYGKIKYRQALHLSKKYRLVFWDVLTYDYDDHFSAEEIVALVKKYTRNGSIITFHDSVKAWPRLEIALPQVLDFLKQEGYEMAAL